MREQVTNQKIIQLHVARHWRRNSGKLGLDDHNIENSIRNPLLADVVSCSCGCRKCLGKMHIPRPQEKKTQKQTEITTRATCGSPNNNKSGYRK